VTLASKQACDSIEVGVILLYSSCDEGEGDRGQKSPFVICHVDAPRIWGSLGQPSESWIGIPGLYAQSLSRELFRGFGGPVGHPQSPSW
jgi:hypothetical protein